MDTFQDLRVLGPHDGVEIEAMSKHNGETVHSLRVIVPDDDSCHNIDSMSNDNDTWERISFGKEMMREVGSALIRLELDLARTSEKLANMNLFMMQVAERESDFESFASEKEVFVDSTAKALEFDILAGIFDSEVKTIDKFICSLQSQIDVISSHKDLGDGLFGVEEKLQDAEESIKQSREQVINLMVQSAKFRRILPNKTSHDGEDTAIVDDAGSLNTNEKLKMQTFAQQHNILRMLEKSLARELDLDQKLTDSTQALDEMKFRLFSSKQEYLSLEEETVSVYTRFFEADNASVILMAITKELICQLQSCQLNIDTALQRESELKSSLQNSIQTVQRMENEENSAGLALNEKVNSLEEQLKASDIMLHENASNIEQIKELKEKIALAESRVEKAETECQLLAEANEGLDMEVDHLKGHNINNEKVDLLEKQVAEINNELQQAMVAVEASEEKQSMLNSMISDMDGLIVKLEMKVCEANSRADYAEEKWIVLSENNEEINEELGFLRGKLEWLEMSLQKAEEMKLATIKDINFQTNMITDLVMKLAMEREHLHKQIYMLINDNRTLANKLDSANNTISKSMNREEENVKEELFSEYRSGRVDDGKRETEDADTTEVNFPRKESCESSSQNSTSKLETFRVIDPSWDSIKYLISTILIALLAILAFCFLQPERCPF